MWGWLAWVSLSALAIFAGGCVALRLYPERGLFHRGAVALLVTVALVLSAIQLAGFAGILTAVPLGLIALGLFSTTAGIALAPIRARALARVKEDVRTLSAALRTGWTWERVWLAACALGAFAFGCVLERVWYLRTCGWDEAWYHTPITDFTLQQGSLAWISSPVTNVQGFARNIELLGVWNCIFPRDNRLDDASQVIFLVMGVLLIAAWSRRFGVPRTVALGLGALWLCMPPIFMEGPHNGNDIACGVLIAATVYFLLDAPSAANRWMAVLAASLYVGAKYTAVLHLLLLAPLVAYTLAIEVRNAPRRAAKLGNVALSFAAGAWLGIWKYVQNALHTGNPFWPMDATVPILKWHLAGTYFPSRVDYIPFAEDPRMRMPPGSSYSWFFLRTGDFDKLIRSWLDPAPLLETNVHSGGFGAIFRWLLVPCVLAVVLAALAGKRRREGLAVGGLFLLAVIVPAAYWPRYIVAASIASLLAFALLWSLVRPPALRIAGTLAALGLGFFTFQSTAHGGSPIDRFRDELRAMPAQERARVQVEPFLWPKEIADLRDHELGPGDVLAFDESPYFETDLFSPDFHTRVVFVSSLDRSTYLQRLREVHPKWVVADPRVARLLIGSGATRIWSGPPVHIYRMPPAFSDGAGPTPE